MLPAKFAANGAVRNTPSSQKLRSSPEKIGHQNLYELFGLRWTQKPQLRAKFKSIRQIFLAQQTTTSNYLQLPATAGCFFDKKCRHGADTMEADGRPVPWVQVMISPGAAQQETTADPGATWRKQNMPMKAERCVEVMWSSNFIKWSMQRYDNKSFGNKECIWNDINEIFEIRVCHHLKIFELILFGKSQMWIVRKGMPNGCQQPTALMVSFYNCQQPQMETRAWTPNNVPCNETFEIHFKQSFCELKPTTNDIHCWYYVYWELHGKHVNIWQLQHGISVPGPVPPGSIGTTDVMKSVGRRRNHSHGLTDVDVF